MIRQSLLETWRRNFFEKQLKNGAWDLRREMLKPGSCRVRQEQREIADDEQVIVRAT